jgi:hypothetical protein
MGKFMPTFKYQKGQDIKYIPNATLYKGKVVSQEGNKFKPYFNKELITDEIKEKLSAIKYINSSNEATALPYMLVMGENVGGGIMIDTDMEKAQKEKEEQEAIRNGEKPLRIGYSPYGLGMMLLDRISPDLFAKIKPHAQYFKANEEDMEFLDDQYGIFCPNAYEVRGWYYEKETIAILHNAGVKMVYSDISITSYEEFTKAVEYVRVQEEKNERERKEKKKLEESFSQKIRDLEKTYVSEEEAKEAKKLPEIHILDFQGATIYGGGKWLHVKDDETGYVVINNGHDGDDWRLNNYDTGGAGAICYKVAGLKKILDEIKQANL